MLDKFIYRYINTTFEIQLKLDSLFKWKLKMIMVQNIIKVDDKVTDEIYEKLG